MSEKNFADKPGLVRALAIIDTLPANSTLAEVRTAIAKENGYLFVDLPIAVMTSQRVMSEAIAEVSETFKIPVYYVQNNHFPIASELSNFVVSKDVLDPGTAMERVREITDIGSLFDKVEFTTRRVLKQSNAHIVFANVVVTNPLAALILSCYGYQALRLDIRLRKRLFSQRIQELSQLAGLGIDMRLSTPTDAQLEEFLAGRADPSSFTSFIARAEIVRSLTPADKE